MNGIRSDAGLQPERTELAWRRTALSIGIASLAAARLLPEVFGHAAWLLPGVLGVAFAGVVWRSGRRRYAVIADRFGSGAMPGAGPLLAVAAGVISFGALAAGTVLVVSR